MGYFDNKENMIKKANEHIAFIKNNYDKEISNSISKSYKIREVYMYNRPLEKEAEIKVVPIDTVKALFEFSRGKTAVLNFASYKEPGGMFMQGSSAQEECLCHASTLYPVLKHFEYTFYMPNRKSVNKGLYYNAAIYSEDILFFDGDKTYLADVISCAAPNYRTAKKYCNVSSDENYRALRNRVEFVVKVAAEQEVDTLILGAWGCGVFGQNPMEVATLFKEYLKKYPYFKTVVFAILPGPNYDAFEKVFNE